MPLATPPSVAEDAERIDAAMLRAAAATTILLCAFFHALDADFLPCRQKIMPRRVAAGAMLMMRYARGGFSAPHDADMLRRF